MNGTETDRIVNDTLRSIDNISPSVPDDILFQKIMNGIHQDEDSFLKANSHAGKFVMAFAVLILINAFSLFSYQNSVENKTVNNIGSLSNELNEFSKTFFSATDEYSYDKR